jgi:hypothetical protein
MLKKIAIAGITAATLIAFQAQAHAGLSLNGLAVNGLSANGLALTASPTVLTIELPQQVCTTAQ